VAERRLLGGVSLNRYLSWLVVVNVIMAVAYARDQRAARPSASLVPEQTMLLLNLAAT
jgi:uncharacterized membrane protein YsdA (DUF1294 family)